ncbi:hypothetical protein ACFVTJ_07275 [Agrobacterium sp. NPDC058088]|uniref:hypothetical protein n=1 Tax=Agrobacterium sp. NPDC058088 TaxID=3346335 RepID=UPI0036DD6329
MSSASTFIKRFFFIAIKQLLRLETALIRSSQPNYEKAASFRVSLSCRKTFNSDMTFAKSAAILRVMHQPQEKMVDVAGRTALYRHQPQSG